MVLVITATVFKPKFAQKTKESLTRRKTITSVALFFFIGIYGGFIQAGIGFIMIAALTGVHGFGMAKTNSIKVFTALCYTSAALVVFIIENKIRWDYGLALAGGSAAGGWIGSRWSVNKSDKLIKVILMITVLALSIKLWFFN